MAHGALEAIGVIVLIQRLHPAVSGGNGEATTNALGGEKIVPIFFAVWKAILQVE